jgi:predicted nucleic acid-binding protein
VIYVDTSVALAHLLGEVRAPDVTLWDGVVVSSRLLEYELWNRVHARGLMSSHGDAVRALLQRISMLELTPAVLARARAPFPVPVRTLDGLHLASIDYMRTQRQVVSLATYDRRMAVVAEAMGIAVMKSV